MRSTWQAVELPSEPPFGFGTVGRRPVQGELRTPRTPVRGVIQFGECLCGLAVRTANRNTPPPSLPSPEQPVPAETIRATPGRGGRLCWPKERPRGVLHVTGRWYEEFAESEMAPLRSTTPRSASWWKTCGCAKRRAWCPTLSTLIQEMHHRIKNNLQTVADLLSLEIRPAPARRRGRACVTASPVSKASLRCTSCSRWSSCA